MTDTLADMKGRVYFNLKFLNTREEEELFRPETTGKPMADTNIIQ